MINIIPGMCLKPNVENACINEICRVLHVNKELDRLVLIPVEPRRRSGRIYFRNYIGRSLREAERQLSPDNPLLMIVTVIRRADVRATNEELDAKYRWKKQETCTARSKRTERWALIKPLVVGADPSLLFNSSTLNEILFAHARSIATHAEKIDYLRTKLKELLNQFWAEGSTPEALTPFTGAIGWYGKEKNQVRKLGRKNAPTKNGLEGFEGFVITPEDKEIIRFCWRNYMVRGATVAAAYRKMCREFFSEQVKDASGKVSPKLRPQHRRPSISQFKRWGSEQSPNETAWKKQLLPQALQRIDRPLSGTANDDIVAVGQRAAIDSSPPDMQFVSVLNRLDRIGPANRILVVDSLFSYIPGFYLGLDYPGTKTVKLAILHAMTDKSEWLRFLGIEDQSPDDWIPIRFSSVISDNTDLRTEEIMRDLASVGATGLSFVPVARSDLNSQVEVAHHRLHRFVDHKMLGTTYARRSERGEQRADDRARHTIVEAIRETVRAIHAHNTMPLDIVPTLEMRELTTAGIPLTPLNLTKWRMDQGKLALTLLDEDECRSALMPRIRGTFTASGVKLLRPGTGSKREFIEPLRYLSNHPLILIKLREAKNERNRRAVEYFDADFLHNPYKTTEIFFRNQREGELIRLDLCIKDRELPHVATIYDVLDIMKKDSVDSFYAKEQRDQVLSQMEIGQEATKEEAEAKYQAVLLAEAKPPSKAKLRGNKSINREREAKQYLYGMPVQLPDFPEDMSGDALSGTASENLNLSDQPQPGEARYVVDQPSIVILDKVEISGANLLVNAIRKRRDR